MQSDLQLAVSSSMQSSKQFAIQFLFVCSSRARRFSAQLSIGCLRRRFIQARQAVPFCSRDYRTSERRVPSGLVPGDSRRSFPSFRIRFKSVSLHMVIRVKTTVRTAANTLLTAALDKCGSNGRLASVLADADLRIDLLLGTRG